MKITPLPLLLLAALVWPTAALGQSVVGGLVAASDSGEPLPSATVQVEGTFTGTVTNADGRFSIPVERFPATLVVRFVGYATERVRVEAPTRDLLRVVLQPEPYQLSEVVVSSEDPAVRIMREVIARKQERRARLDRFRASAYNRFTIENDTGIVSITEGLSTFLWDRERGSREVVTASRQTDNVEFDGFLPAALFVANLYDDNIDVSGHNLMGITNPDALDHYRFRLEGTTRQEGREVYTISVETRRKLATGFEGTISVADEVYALLTVDLRPNDAFLFPPPIQFFDVTYRQQYLPYGEDQWLPADFRAELDLKVGFRGVLDFPVFRIRQFSRLSDYEINVPLPDSVYAEDRIVLVDSAAVRADTLLNNPARAVPLSAREETAYASIDSTQTLEKAFAPGGVLGRAARVSAAAEETQERRTSRLGFLSVTPDLTYNRVEGFSPALRAVVGGDAALYGRFGRAFGPEENVVGFGARLRRGRGEIQVGWDRRFRPMVESRTRFGLENSLGFLLGAADYFDYYRSERIEAVLEFGRNEPFRRFTVGVRRDDASPASRTTDFQLIENEPVAENPAITPGRVGSVVADVRIGAPHDPFGFTGGNSLRIKAELAGKDLFGSDFGFARAQVLGAVRVPTFYRRRFLPQVLDVTLNLGVSNGALPPYRLWGIDGSNRGSKPASLRTLHGRPAVGDRTVLLTWEHNFRTVPFERIGWRWAVERNWSIVAFAGHGRTWLRPENAGSVSFPVGWAPQVTDGWHHEAGLSLSGVFGLLRLDVARRLDRGDWAVGFGAARIF